MDVDYSSLLGKMINSPFSTPVDRERMVKLLLSEREKEFVTEERVKELMREYTFNENLPPYPPSGSDKSHVHRPKDTYMFLSLFGGEDYGIKNLTHDFNGDFPDYDEFLATCEKQFDDAKKSFPHAVSSVVKRIEQFAFNTNPEWYTCGWSRKKEYHLGWKKKEVKEWCIENRLHPKHNETFNKEMITPFKNIIQVRADTGNLKDTINDLKEDVFGNFCKVDVKDSVVDANFYTDVDSLANAIQIIFKMIKERAERTLKTDIVIDYELSGSWKNLIITHKDSVSTKLPEDKDYLGGDMKSLRNVLWNLCNFEVRSLTQDGRAFKKTIMNENRNLLGKVEYLSNPNNIEGFSYILKFY